MPRLDAPASRAAARNFKLCIESSLRKAKMGANATHNCGRAERYMEPKMLEAEVLAVSTDSRFVHQVWQEQELSKMVEGGVAFYLR